MISDIPNYMTLDSPDAPWNDDYIEEIPDPEFWHYTFRDGSEIMFRDFEEPIVSGKRKCMAREVAGWIEENEADNDQAIHYILTNEKIS